MKKLIADPMYFYSLTLSLIYIPLSFATKLPIFLLIIPINIWCLSKIDKIKFPYINLQLKLVNILLLPIIHFVISAYVIPRFLKVEGNVFAFTLIFTALPILLLNFIGLIRYSLSLSDFEDKNLTDKNNIFVNGIKETRIEETDNSFKIFIHDKNNITFESLKQELQNQYSPLGFKNVIFSKETSWMIKNDNQSYVLLSHKGDEYIVEAYNTEKPILSIQKT